MLASNLEYLLFIKSFLFSIRYLFQLFIKNRIIHFLRPLFSLIINLFGSVFTIHSKIRPLFIYHLTPSRPSLVSSPRTRSPVKLRVPGDNARQLTKRDLYNGFTASNYVKCALYTNITMIWKGVPQ